MELTFCFTSSILAEKKKEEPASQHWDTNHEHREWGQQHGQSSAGIFCSLVWIHPWICGSAASFGALFLPSRQHSAAVEIQKSS